MSKSDLQARPVFRRKRDSIEAHQAGRQSITAADPGPDDFRRASTPSATSAAMRTNFEPTQVSVGAAGRRPEGRALIARRACASGRFSLATNALGRRIVR